MCVKCRHGLKLRASYANNLGVKKFLHQSYFFVAVCAGIVAGMALAQIFDCHGLASPVWLVVAILLLAYAFIYPARALLVAAFLAGILIATLRTCLIPDADFQAADSIVAMRDGFRNQLNLNIGTPEAQLGAAYLLGVKDGLPTDLNNSLRAIGLAHIVVASGTHLAILAKVIRNIFGKISRRVSVVLTVLFVIFFMSLVGFTPSILRAGIVTILSLSMWYVGRKFAPWRIILITATITLLISPTFLMNLGWQMSFASFVGVMVLGPKIQNFFYGKEKPGFVAGTIITTVAATLATLPITIYYFGAFSLIAVLANLLILPTLPFAMGLTFGAGLPLVGPIFAFLAKGLLHLHILIVEFFAKQTYFTVQIPAHNAWVFLLYLPILVTLIIEWHKNRRRYIIKA